MLWLVDVVPNWPLQFYFSQKLYLGVGSIQKFLSCNFFFFLYCVDCAMRDLCMFISMKTPFWLLYLLVMWIKRVIRIAGFYQHLIFHQRWLWIQAIVSISAAKASISLTMMDKKDSVHLENWNRVYWGETSFGAVSGPL